MKAKKPTRKGQMEKKRDEGEKLKAKIIVYYKEGWGIEYIASVLEVSRQYVYRIIKKYKEQIEIVENIIQQQNNEKEHMASVTDVAIAAVDPPKLPEETEADVDAILAFTIKQSEVRVAQMRTLLAVRISNILNKTELHRNDISFMRAAAEVFSATKD